MADQDPTPPPGVPSVIEEIASEVDGLPLPPAVKRSLWKSVGRLIGSVADLGVAVVEHGTARIGAKTDAVDATAEARRVVKLGMAAKVPDMIAADKALSNRAVAYLGHEMLVEQANRERIVGHVVEDLRSAPPQEDPGQEIDDDWLHAFMKEASTKSAPEMQLLFGKILSGEIKRPGAFSLKTVRVLGMMSKITAKQFETLCNLSVMVSTSIKVISYFGQAGQNSLAKHGLPFRVLNNLNENDLIYGSYNTQSDWTPVATARMPFEYANENVWLEAKDTKKLRRLAKIHGVQFSEVGKELRQIVSMRPDPSYTLELIKFFEAGGCDLIKVLGRRSDRSFVGKRYGICFDRGAVVSSYAARSPSTRRSAAPRCGARAGTRRSCSRSELIQEPLVWHLRVQTLPIEEPSSEEREALAAGRAPHARCEFVTLDEIRRD